jgi:hypothetical protein
MAHDPIGYIVSDSPIVASCAECGPAGAAVPVRLGGLAGGLACATCGRRLDGSSEPPVAGSEVEARIRLSPLLRHD